MSFKAFRYIIYQFAIILVIFLPACREEKDISITETKYEQELEGLVVSDNNVGLAQVSVLVDGKYYTSDEKGYFHIPHQQYSGAIVLNFFQNNRNIGYKTINDPNSRHNFVKFKVDHHLNFTSYDGSDVSNIITSQSRMTLTIPKNGIKNKDQSSFENVFLASLDYTNVDDGDFDLKFNGTIQYSDLTDEIKYFQPICQFELSLLDFSNAPVIDLNKDLASNFSCKKPSSIVQSAGSWSLFFLDEEIGRWKYLAKVEENGDFLNGKINLQGIYCIGKTQSVNAVQFVVKDIDNAPLSYARYKIQNINNEIEAFGFTNRAGVVSTFISASATSKIVLINECGEASGQSLEALNSNTSQVMVSFNKPKYQFSGRVEDCNNNAFGAGKIFLQNNNSIIGLSEVGSDGRYKIVVPEFCDSLTNVILNFIPSDIQSAASTFSYNQIAKNNVFNPKICNNTAPFFEIKFSNGQSKKYTTFIEYQNIGTLRGHNANIDLGFSVSFQSALKKGTNPIQSFNMIEEGFETYETVKGNFVVTKMPTRIGEFYEGYFSFDEILGYINGSESRGLTASGTFKIEKKQ